MRFLKSFLAALCSAALLISCSVPAFAAVTERAEPEPSPIAAGFLHSAIVTEDGVLWTAGDNACGQLGTGPLPEAAESVNGDDETTCTAEFLKVMDNIRAVYAGYLTTFAIAGDGLLYGWGWNANYQIGVGDTEDRMTPVEVLANTVSVAPGRFHTAAITSDKTLWTWGYNNSGQLGVGSVMDLVAPKEALFDVRSVALGMEHTMAVKTDNTLWAAGNNLYGQLADGGTESVTEFTQVMDHVQDVACTAFGTLILKTDGSLWVCGYNRDGQLGNGTYDDIAEPEKILDSVSSVAGSVDFAAAIDREGTLYAWGKDPYGQYAPQMSPYPVEVAQNVLSVSLGGGHILYLLEDGTVKAQGNNEKGQCGDNTFQNVPIAATVMENVALVSRSSSGVPVILLVAAIVAVVVLLFTYLIVRTLKGKKEKKPSPEPSRKETKEKPMSDRELIRLAGEMEQELEEIPEENRIDVESVLGLIVKDEEDPDGTDE